MKVKPTTVTNLVRAEESGIYYARAKVCGKIHWRSLETETFSVAKLRLPDVLTELRKLAPVEVQAEPKMTFTHALERYKKQVNENPRLKPRAKQFRLRSEATLRRTWPAIFEMELRRISSDQCKTWLTSFENGGSKYQAPRTTGAPRAGNSPTTVNALIAFLRHVFAIGVEAGVMHKNPALDLAKKKPRRKLLRLPNKSQFARMVATIRAAPGWGRKAGDFVEGLAYSGARVGELRLLTWGHLDFEKSMVTIPGEKTDAAPRVVPMTGKFRELVSAMQEGRDTRHDLPVFEVQEASESLAGACRKVGVAHMTHHDLRHLFATTCIESGVDVPTVSRWLGHSDGGALAMRTYGHLRPEHSIEAAKRVRFD